MLIYILKILYLYEVGIICIVQVHVIHIMIYPDRNYLQISIYYLIIIVSRQNILFA